jgi:hypothetical protein
LATLILTVLLACAIGGLTHWWPLLGGPARRRLAIATNLAGVAALVAALQAEGLRQSATTSAVIVGAGSHTLTSSASASLYYYVLTAACLSLGFVGFAFGEPLARWLAPRPILSTASVAWMLTLMRFLLEKSAAPPVLAQAVGVTWLAPFAGAFVALGLRESQPGWRPLARQLVGYAFLVRGFVAAVSLVATTLRLGTHYDVSPITELALGATGRVIAFEAGSVAQRLWLVLVPQLVLWPVYTVLAGLVGGTLALRLARPRARGRAAAADTAAAGQ